MIYFDNAATSLFKPPEVAEAVAAAITSFGNDGRGAHGAALSSSRAIYETRVLLAELFGASDPEQVVFTMNATMALNMAIKGILKPQDHVITTAMEHNSVLRPLYEMEELGVELTILPCDHLGRVSYQEMEAAIKENTRAIICTHVSNVTGNVNDIHQIGAMCKKHQLLFLLDASQSAGVFPINMEKDGISVVCFTGHKGLLGPQGTGGLCIKRGLTLRPLVSGGTGVYSFLKGQPESMPEHLEAGTRNSHGIAGLHAALTYHKKYGIARIQKKEQELARYFYESLKNEKDLIFYGDFEAKERGGIVTFNIGEYDSSLVSDELASRFEIYTRAGAHCAPRMHESMGTKEQGAVRVSFSHQNTKEEVNIAVDAVRTLIYE